MHTCDGTAPHGAALNLNDHGLDHFLGQGVESVALFVMLMMVLMMVPLAMLMMVPITTWAIAVAIVIPAAALVTCGDHLELLTLGLLLIPI